MVSIRALFIYSGPYFSASPTHR